MSGLETIYDIKSDGADIDKDKNNVLLCMKLSDNIHDFCKGRANLNFKLIEDILKLGKFIIKNSPSTIEENTTKQLTINTGLYEKMARQKPQLQKYVIMVGIFILCSKHQM